MVYVELSNLLFFPIDKEKPQQQNKSIIQIIIDEDVLGLRETADIDLFRVPDGKSIVHLACCYKKDKILGEILKLYPYLARAKDDNDCEPMHFAAYVGDVGIAKILVASGADPKASARGVYPIHRAAQRGSVDMLKYLQTFYDHVDVIDVGGNTPYHWASLYQHRSILELLHSQGADRHKRNYHGVSPVAYARRC